jgi:hypothetical protein
MLIELWRDIKGYEGLYEVSNFGRVYGIKSGKIVKPYLNNRGYLKVDLYKGGKYKKVFVHRIVAETFLPNPNHYPQVNHKDEDKTNNFIYNLEFCDCRYNIDYGTGHDRAAEKSKKAVFCIELNKTFKSITEASRDTGICLQSISMCCRGNYKTAGGYHWGFE